MTIAEILKSGNYHLVDVREPMELEMDGYFESAVNIPLGEVAERKDEILSLEGPKILFCRSGKRSEKAIEFLASEGGTNLYNGGGFADLEEIFNTI
ncbi:rhodanese-like domain-containing protein [Riemerella columbipharyngis]|uniref:Rhodanese-related sulfurtransferase n=1 Tax=Riemerella columbipharyngis TaxID=1071918 RepID=A0A1G6ZJS7_9FLAO|nr:rhodanese-like domain-containing protein [Riemerella columbipharyngis]SDE02909.1 Rhodanese-related sulfurtransferase [Riemerella columbipharyngis]